MGSFRKQGEPQVWGTAAALSITLLMVLTLLGVVMVNGLGFFWPSDTSLVTLKDGSRLLGEITSTEKATENHGKRIQFKVGNRDIYGQDFRWVDASEIRSTAYPDDAVTLERKERGNFYGFLKSLSLNGLRIPAGGTTWDDFLAARKSVDASRAKLRKSEKRMADLNSNAERLRLKVLKLSSADPVGNRPRSTRSTQRGKSSLQSSTRGWSA